MYPITYYFTVPNRLIFPLIPLFPMFTQIMKYFTTYRHTLGFQEWIEESIVYIVLSAVFFIMGLYFATKSYSLEVSTNYLATKKRRYLPEEIEELTFDRKSGMVALKLKGSLDVREFRIRKMHLPDAIGELVDWSERNHIKYEVLR